MFIVFPADKNQNSVVNKLDLSDLDNQVNILNKLDKKFAKNNEKNNFRINITEIKTILTSYKHIIKSIRFESLIPQFVALILEGISKIKINKTLGIHPYQYDLLAQYAVDRGMLEPDSIQKRKEKPGNKNYESKFQNNNVILSDTNYNYIKKIADARFSGNTYQAVNAVITAMRELQEKNILDSKLNSVTNS
jgi:hypothetical protein